MQSESVEEAEYLVHFGCAVDSLGKVTGPCCCIEVVPNKSADLGVTLLVLLSVVCIGWHSGRKGEPDLPAEARIRSGWQLV